jgi:hypothetical protein
MHRTYILRIVNFDTVLVCLLNLSNKHVNIMIQILWSSNLFSYVNYLSSVGREMVGEGLFAFTKSTRLS